MKKRILSLLLSIVMVAAMLPTTVFATIYEFQTVDMHSLTRGDVVTKGTVIYVSTKGSYIDYPKQISSDYPADRGPTYSRQGYYTCDKNYYVVHSYGADRTLYLYPLPTVTFNANGGSVDMESKWVIPSPGTNCTYGDLPTPTRTNCTFVGWFTAAEGGTQVTSSTTVTQTSNHTLYARWIPHSITFNYQPNGGSPADNNVTWVATADGIFPDNHWNYTNSSDKNYMTRTGYTATGYYAKTDGTCLYGQDFVFESYEDLCAKYGVSTSTQSTTIDIYAQWSPNIYTVSFNGNGATGGSTAAQSFTYDTAQNLRANGFQQKYTVTYDLGDGPTATSATATSTFKGWNTATNGSGTAYSNQQSVKNLTAINGDAVTLYAQWTKGSVTLPSPQKTGMVCTGWYTSSGTKVGDCGGNYTPSDNITLYAHWETLGHTVTWKNYDGTILETDAAVAQGATPTYNGAIPAKPDTTEKSYIFSGWSPAISPVTGNVTYTAQFTETPRQYALGLAYDETKGELTGNENAPVGSVVTVNVLPNNGYGVKEITAYKTGDKSTSVSIDSTSYTFIMPAFDVTVEVSWVESDVIYTSAYKDIEPTFTVTIPATVGLGNEIAVKAEDVRLNKGSQVEISIADAIGLNAPFTMTSGEGYTFNYQITAGGAVVSPGAKVLVINPDTSSEGNTILKFEKPNRAVYAGNYSGSVIFTIAVKSAENNSIE